MFLPWSSRRYWCLVHLSLQFVDLVFLESRIYGSTKRFHITLRYPARPLKRSKVIRRDVRPTQLSHTSEHCAGVAAISREYEWQCEHSRLLISLRPMVGLSVGHIWLEICAGKLSFDDLCWPHQLIYYETGEISSLFRPAPVCLRFS